MAIAQHLKEDFCQSVNDTLEKKKSSPQFKEKVGDTLEEPAKTIILLVAFWHNRLSVCVVQ